MDKVKQIAAQIKSESLIYIEWEDATSCDDWSVARDVLEFRLSLIKTVGFLVFENDEVVTVSLNVDTSDHGCSDYICIPKVNIKKRQGLRL